METLHDAVAKLKASGPALQLVADWKTYVPDGSRWQPGDPGDPSCPHCKGVGYVSAGVPVGHPLFGKLFLCECAEARVHTRMTQQLQTVSALAVEDLALTWGHVSQTEAAGPALVAVRTAILADHGWCYIWGPPGPGKTLILKAAIAECIRAGHPAVYVNWADLLEHLRGGYERGDYDERVDRWRTVPVLAVDEFGRARETEWVREAQARIFNHRYESAVLKKTVTLFASNFPPEKSDDWFADRLRDGRFQIVNMGGPSMRPLMEN